MITIGNRLRNRIFNRYNVQNNNTSLQYPYKLLFLIITKLLGHSEMHVPAEENCGIQLFQ